MNEDRWEIYIKTSLYKGMDTQPVPSIVRLPEHEKNDIDDFVFKLISYILYNESYDQDEDGLQALEIIANRLIRKHVEGIRIRLELYPASVGLCVVINIGYNPNDIGKLNINRGQIGYENKIRRRIAGPHGLRASSQS